jgi:hypothetical protein
MNIGTLTATLGIDDTGLKAAEKTMMDFGKKASLYLTTPLVAAGVGAFKMASDLNESLNKVDVAFDEQAKTVRDWSKTTLESFGIAQGTALDMAALYGDMSTSMGISTKKAAEMSKRLTGLAGDLASFKNIQVDVARTALAGVFTGETESLKRLGIVMTEANVSAWAMANGIEKQYDEMSQAEKVATRYEYVLAMTANSQGDFARTSDGAANQMRIFQESVKEVGATFGQELLPIITPMIHGLNNWLKSLGELTTTQKQWILGGIAASAAIGPLSMGIGLLIKGYTGLVTGVQGTIKVLNVLRLVIIANPIMALVTALAALTTGYLLFRDKADEATESQKKFNSVAKEGLDLREQTKTIQERVNIMAQLNRQQVQDLKQNIEQQLKLEQDHSIKLVEEANRRVTNQKEAVQEYETVIVDGIKTSILTQEGLLKQGLEIDKKTNNERIKELESFLSQTDSRLKAMPLEKVAGTSYTKGIIDALDDLAAKEQYVATMTKIMGNDFQASDELLNAYKSTLSKLIQEGLNETDINVQKLTQSIQNLNSPAEKSKQIMADMAKELLLIDTSIEASSEGFDVVGSRMEVYQNTLTKLSEAHITTGKEVADLQQKMTAFTPIITDFTSPMNDLQTQLGMVQIKEASLGDLYDSNSAKLQLYTAEWERLLASGDMSSAYYQSIVAGIQQMNLEIDIMQSKQQALQNLSNVFNTIGNSIKGTAGEWFKFFGAFLGSIPTIVNSLKSLQAANAASAIAGATSAGASVPFPGNILAIASGIAAVLSALSTVVPSKMAEGGIIPAGYPNDSYPAMLSTGETVTPPGKLPNISPTKVEVIVKVEGFTKGEDLYHIVKDVETRILNSY